MYAVIETGGKQYRVEVGTELQVDLLDVEAGQSITFDRVLLVGDGDATAIGQPVVADAAVEAEVVRKGRGEKLIVFKYRPKARTRVKKGHRQDHLVLRVTDVKLSGRSAAEERRQAGQDALTERQRLEEAAARQAAADAELAAKLARKSESAGARRGRAAGAPATDQPGTDATAPAEPEPTTPVRRSRTTATKASDEPAAPDAAVPETTTEVDTTTEAEPGPAQRTPAAQPTAAAQPTPVAEPEAAAEPAAADAPSPEPAASDTTEAALDEPDRARGDEKDG
jgi:large subunit ribosomal protein L21